MQCPAGAFCTGNNSVPTGCPLGAVCAAGSAAPEPCPPWHVCVQLNLSAADACPAGRDCSSPWLPTAAASEWSEAERLEAAAPLCAHGFRCDGASKQACEEGQHCPRGSVESQVCPAGCFCSRADNSTGSVLSPCPIGRVCDEGSSAPVACPSGMLCLSANMSSAEAQPCPSGRDCSLAWSNWSLANAEAAASLSYEQRLELAAPPCEAGYYCETIGRFSAKNECPSGMACPAGSAYGIVCAEGTVAPRFGMAACEPCASGKTDAYHQRCLDTAAACSGPAFFYDDNTSASCSYAPAFYVLVVAVPVVGVLLLGGGAYAWRAARIKKARRVGPTAGEQHVQLAASGKQAPTMVTATGLPTTAADTPHANQLV